MNKQWEMVREFHRLFGHPISGVPRELPSARVRARGKWMQEELDEFFEAGNIYEQADAMLDLIYFALGTLVEMGLRPEDAFGIVHDANMKKLWPDGKPHYDADGKTIKPAGWIDPEPRLHTLIDDEIGPCFD